MVGVVVLDVVLDVLDVDVDDVVLDVLDVDDEVLDVEDVFTPVGIVFPQSMPVSMQPCTNASKVVWSQALNQSACIV